MKKEGEADEKDWGTAIRKLRKLADDLERGPTPEELALAGVIRYWDVDLGEQWRALGMLCRRLESLAHKQLRGVAFSDEENRFIRTYGEKLAEVMLYGGNSYCTPNDDAPRVVDVFFNPNPMRSVTWRWESPGPEPFTCCIPSRAARFSAGAPSCPTMSSSTTPG